MRGIILLLLVLSSVVQSIDNRSRLEDIRRAIREKGLSWVAEENDISRLGEEERRRLVGLKEDDSRRFLLTEDGRVIPITGKEVIRAPFPLLKRELSIPTSLDWRSYGGKDWTTGVRDQGNCGSCWILGFFGAWESRLKIMYNLPDSEIDKSEQAVLSCNGKGWNCSGGPLYGVADYLFREGAPDEGCMPYDYTNYDQVPCSAVCADADKIKEYLSNGAYLYLPETPDEAKIKAIKSALQNGPVVVDFDVYEDFLYYKSGIYQYAYGKHKGGHVVTIVGYSDEGEIPYWIVKNSWGTRWGEKGYFRIAQRGHGCEFGAEAYEPVTYRLAANEYMLSVEEVLENSCFSFGNNYSPWCGVEYKIPTNGYLKAIETRFNDVGMFYIVRIYDGISNEGRTGKLLAEKRGELGNSSGVRRIILDQPIQVFAGQEIFIAIRYMNCNFPIPIESENNRYNSGNSWFAFEDNEGWMKMTYAGDFCIRGFVEKGGQAELKVTGPNGGEEWYAGSNQIISWMSYWVGDKVIIEYSTDNGSSWTMIDRAAPNTGSYSWTVPNTPSRYCLVRVSDPSGSPFDVSDGNFVIKAAAGIESNISRLPGRYHLYGNVPNPFNPETEVRYDLPVRSAVRLVIYDVMGREVAVHDAEEESGVHRYVWRPSGAGGIYFCRLEARPLEGEGAPYRSVIKMTYMK